MANERVIGIGPAAAERLSLISYGKEVILENREG